MLLLCVLLAGVCGAEAQTASPPSRVFTSVISLCFGIKRGKKRCKGLSIGAASWAAGRSAVGCGLDVFPPAVVTVPYFD